MCAYHIPALLSESISGLNIKPGGDYVDATFGGGGHSKEILKRINKGRLIAFDQDTEAFQNKLDDKRFNLIHGNFRYIKNFLRFYGFDQIDGIIADLGISFHQIDESKRGFSFKSDAEIDMRMNKNSSFTAAHILNEYDTERLANIFKEYGELNSSWKMSEAIVNSRKIASFKNIGQLISILEKFAPKRMEQKFYAKVFQALRIEVNQEVESLKEFLESMPDLLKSGGRLVIISYHSLEDRLVKNFIKSGNLKGEIVKDIYGNFSSPFFQINRKIIIPSEDEIKINPRSRSAKLRIAERI